MSKLKYKPEDFETGGIIHGRRLAKVLAKRAQAKFDEWLEKQSTVYSTERYEDSRGWTRVPLDVLSEFGKKLTYKAKLVNIERVE